MTDEMLDKIGIPYMLLDFNRVRKTSRFKELINSPYCVELMRVIAEDSITAKEGKKALQQLLENQELCEFDSNSGIAARTAADSTFRRAIAKLTEFGLVEEQPKKEEGRYINSFKLKHNLLLFKRKNGDWIPAAIFTCKNRQAIVKIGGAGGKTSTGDILDIVPDVNFCLGCRAKCSLFDRLKLLGQSRRPQQGGGRVKIGKK